MLLQGAAEWVDNPWGGFASHHHPHGELVEPRSIWADLTVAVYGVRPAEPPSDLWMLGGRCVENDLAAPAGAAKACEEDRFLNHGNDALDSEEPGVGGLARQNVAAFGVAVDVDVGMDVEAHGHRIVADCR